MNLSDIFPAFPSGDSADQPAGSVGTVARPVFLSLADHPRALTGSASQRSIQARLTRLKQVGQEKAGDIVLPIDSRSARRAQAADARRSQRKTQRGYVARQLAEEREANTLAALASTAPTVVSGSAAVKACRAEKTAV